MRFRYTVYLLSHPVKGQMRIVRNNNMNLFLFFDPNTVSTAKEWIIQEARREWNKLISEGWSYNNIPIHTDNHVGVEFAVSHS